MKSTSVPDLSVILSTNSTLEILYRVLKHLRRQTVAEKLEVVIAAPSEESMSTARNRVR